MSQLIELEKLSRHQKGMTAAYRAGMPLQENGWVLFPCAAWDKCAVLAMSGIEVVGGINWSIDEDDNRVHVHFAWCDNEEPHAFAQMLLWFRAKFKGRDLAFAAHPGNAAMMRFVNLLRLKPHTIHYRGTV